MANLKVKKESVRFVLDALFWAYKERAFLWGRLEKYTKLENNVPIKFDGDKVKATIIKYDQVFFEYVRSGFSISAAIWAIISKAVTPHKMTREEEEVFFNRMSGNGQF